MVPTGEEPSDLNKHWLFSCSQTNIQRLWLKQIEQSWIHPGDIFQYFGYKLGFDLAGNRQYLGKRVECKLAGLSVFRAALKLDRKESCSANSLSNQSKGRVWRGRGSRESNLT